MLIINSGPAGFFGLDTIFELVAALVTFLVSILSYRAYKFAKQKKFYHMFSAFLLISMAFALRAAGVFLLHLGFYERIVSILNTFDIIFLAQMALMLMAYTMLLLVSMNVQNKRVAAFVMTLMTLFIVFSYQYYLKFHIMLFVLLFFLTVNYYLNFRKQKTFNSALVFVSFYLLMLAQPFFLFTVHLSQNYYVLGQGFHLMGFLVLFFATVRLLRVK